MTSGASSCIITPHASGEKQDLARVTWANCTGGWKDFDRRAEGKFRLAEGWWLIVNLLSGCYCWRFTGAGRCYVCCIGSGTFPASHQFRLRTVRAANFNGPESLECRVWRGGAGWQPGSRTNKPDSFEFSGGVQCRIWPPLDWASSRSENGSDPFSRLRRAGENDPGAESSGPGGIASGTPARPWQEPTSTARTWAEQETVPGVTYAPDDRTWLLQSEAGTVRLPFNLWNLG